MKYKLLSILFLFMVLLTISNASFAHIYVTGDDTSIVLQDIDITSDSYLMTYNYVEDMAELIVAPENSKIYYDLASNSFYCADSNYTPTDFTYYYCVITDNVGGEWSSATTKSSFNYAGQEKIKQVGNIYPCRKVGNVFIDKLPDGVTWEDSFYMSHSNGHIIMLLAPGEGVWVNVSGDGIGNRYRTSYNSSADIELQQYNYINNNWEYLGTHSSTHGYFNEAICYTDDIINTDGTVFASGMRSFFQLTPVMEAKGILAPILGEVEMMEPTMKEILTLVPIMIILIVSYLGLRKGLTFIKTLRKM